MLTPTFDPDVQRSMYAHYWNLGTSYADKISEEETEILRKEGGRPKGSNKGKMNPKVAKQRFDVKPPGRRADPQQVPGKGHSRPRPSSSGQPMDVDAYNDTVQEGNDDENWGKQAQSTPMPRQGTYINADGNVSTD